MSQDKSASLPVKLKTEAERMTEHGLKYWYLVFVSMYSDPKGKRFYCYLEITEEEAMSGEIEKSKMRNADYRISLSVWDSRLGCVNPGSILRVKGPADQDRANRIVVKTAEYFKRIPDANRAIRWTADFHAAQREATRKKESETDRARNLVYETLEPLREAYRNASAVKRQQMLADFIRYITS